MEEGWWERYIVAKKGEKSIRYSELGLLRAGSTWLDILELISINHTEAVCSIKMTMSSAIRITQVFLLLLAACGFYSTWCLVYNNGTVKMMEQIRDHGPHILPGTKEPLKKNFTGIGRLDYQLTVLTLFFWEQGKDLSKILI